jgi:hypothetical protein
MAVVNPFEGLINGVLQGHAIATQLRNQAMQEEAYQRAKARDEQDSQLRDLEATQMIRSAGRPVTGNAVQESAPTVVQNITRQMAPGGAPTRLDDGSYGIASVDDLPQTRPTLTPEVTDVTYTRPVDKSRLLTYKTRSGETVQSEAYTPEELLQKQLAHTSAVGEATARSSALADVFKRRADRAYYEGELARRGVAAPDIVVQAGLARPGERLLPEDLRTLIPAAQGVLTPTRQVLAPGASLVEIPKPGISGGAPAPEPEVEQPAAAGNPLTNPLLAAGDTFRQARQSFIDSAKSAGNGEASAPTTPGPRVVVKGGPPLPTGDFERVFLPAFAKKRGKTPETLAPDETMEAVGEYARRSKDPATASLARELAQARLDDLKAKRNTTPTPIAPGTREFKVAQDLAYGRLTMQQFRSLYAFSRDTNKKLDIYDKASELNPNFNPASFEMGYRFAASPKIQQQLAAMDNVMLGVDDLLKASDAASRTGVTTLNKYIQKGGIALGGKRYSDFHTAQIGFADELSGALGFGGATDMSRQMGVDMTNPNLSPEAFRLAIENVVIPFIQRKRKSFLDQMGIYGQPGMNPGAGHGGEKAGGPPAGATVSVTDPQGGVHWFPDQASANQFKKLARIP